MEKERAKVILNVADEVLVLCKKYELTCAEIEDLIRAIDYNFRAQAKI